jgi:segregation and condensation protein B
VTDQIDAGEQWTSTGSSSAESPERDRDGGPDVVAGPSLQEPAQLRAALEAILFVLDAPVDVTTLAVALERPVPEVETAVRDLRSALAEGGSGVELREAAGGVRLYTRAEYAPWVERFLTDGQRSRLSQAALETLAVIAYRQPVTRSRIAAIRGVNVDGVVRTLLSRGLIVETGPDPTTGGGLYRTTDAFLEKMGLESLADLPSLAPLLPELDTLDDDQL